jgi:putative sigma-54 modulation protein
MQVAGQFDERFSNVGRSPCHGGGGAYGEEMAGGRHGRNHNHPDAFGQPTREEFTIMNHTPNNHEVIVSGIHLDLTPSLKFYVNEKVGRLFRHEERIVRVRVELESDGKNDATRPFVAKGHIAIHGPDMNCSVASDECHKAVDLLVDKLDRMLRRRARLFKVKRKHPHAVELGALLPKTA